MTLKSGRYYYLQPVEGSRTKKWISLSKNFDEALQQYEALRRGEVSAAALAKTAPKQGLVRELRACFDSAKKRSRDRDATYFALTFDDVFELAMRQNWRCALTNIPFAFDRPEGSHVRPFMVSIDRISSAGGYTKGNVRLVCVAVNLALSTYGEAVFGRIARAYAQRTSVRRTAPR